MHLTLDAFGCDPKLLNDVKVIANLLDTYPGRIGMTKISEPKVFHYEGVKPEDHGVSGFVLIAESHIAIHTFPEHGQVWVDVFSCKGFEEDPAVKPILETFKAKTHRINKLERGLEYPHNVKASIPLNRSERKEVAAEVSTSQRK